MKEIVGDLLAIERGIIVHGCNCQGVMGSGVAGALAAKWPTVYAGYRNFAKINGLVLGDIYINSGKTLGFKGARGDKTPDLPENLVIVNAMTQYDYGMHQRQVDYDAIFACFARVRMLAKHTNLPVFFPLIGAGLGGGAWEVIAPLIDLALGPDVDSTLIRLQ
jgi:O-acetyl-ADP-ribose deacetylase (regulator of RNase III)